MISSVITILGHMTLVFLFLRLIKQINKLLIEIPGDKLGVTKTRRSGRTTTEQLVCIMTGKKVSP